MKETEKETENKEFREYHVPEAKESFKQQDVFCSVNGAEKADEDGSTSIIYTNTEAISDSGPEKAVSKA